VFSDNIIPFCDLTPHGISARLLEIIVNVMIVTISAHSERWDAVHACVSRGGSVLVHLLFPTPLKEVQIILVLSEYECIPRRMAVKEVGSTLKG
jgi:hypothetical protein